MFSSTQILPEKYIYIDVEGYFLANHNTNSIRYNVCVIGANISTKQTISSSRRFKI